MWCFIIIPFLAFIPFHFSFMLFDFPERKIDIRGDYVISISGAFNLIQMAETSISVSALLF